MCFVCVCVRVLIISTLTRTLFTSIKQTHICALLRWIVTKCICIVTGTQNRIARLFTWNASIIQNESENVARLRNATVRSCKPYIYILRKLGSKHFPYLHLEKPHTRTHTDAHINFMHIFLLSASLDYIEPNITDWIHNTEFGERESERKRDGERVYFSKKVKIANNMCARMYYRYHFGVIHFSILCAACTTCIVSAIFRFFH